MLVKIDREKLVQNAEQYQKDLQLALFNKPTTSIEEKAQFITEVLKKCAIKEAPKDKIVKIIN